VILIAGSPANIDTTGWPPLARDIYERKRRSPYVFNYSSSNHLRFEMLLRAAIVQAAIDLDRSGVEFATFEFARCNDRYWRLTPRGGFQLRQGVRPSVAIRDIYLNGPMYAFECATAIPIIYYKAVLEVLGEEQFDRLFQDLLLYSWNYDSDLGLIQERVSPERAVPGDVLYFDNPDFHPRAPEWQGVNVVMIDDDLFFGHGVGITTGADIIRGLNMRRRPFSFRSAYLMDLIVYPDFAYLSRFMPRPAAGAGTAASSESSGTASGATGMPTAASTPSTTGTGMPGTTDAGSSGATASVPGAETISVSSMISQPWITHRDPGDGVSDASSDSRIHPGEATAQQVDVTQANTVSGSVQDSDPVSQPGDDTLTTAAGYADSAAEPLHRPGDGASPDINSLQSVDELATAPWLTLPQEDSYRALPRIRARVGRRRYIW
jgi:protein-glutamine gamma-glutamyltransferase